MVNKKNRKKNSQSSGDASASTTAVGQAQQRQQQPGTSSRSGSRAQPLMQQEQPGTSLASRPPIQHPQQQPTNVGKKGQNPLKSQQQGQTSGTLPLKAEPQQNQQRQTSSTSRAPTGTPFPQQYQPSAVAPAGNVWQKRQEQNPSSLQQQQSSTSASAALPSAPRSTQQSAQIQQQRPQPMQKPTEKADNAHQLSQLTLQDSTTKSTSSLPVDSSKSAESTESVKSQAQMLDYKIPPRKESGTWGTPIKVLANMLPIIFGKKFPSEIIHYDVDIVPDKPKYLMRGVFFKAIGNLFENRHPAFDGGKNAYSRDVLFEGAEVSTDVTVFNEDGKEKTFKFTMKEAKRLDFSWINRQNSNMEERFQTCVQALDIIFRNASAINSKTIVGRSFFTPPLPGQVVSLGDGMDLWVGTFQSTVLGQWKPLLNVDVAHKGFPTPQRVTDLMKSICGVVEGGIGAEGHQGQSYNRGNRGGYYNRGGRGGRGGGQQYGRGPPPTELTPDLIHQHRDEIVNYLKGLKVKYEIPGQATSRRTYRVNDLVKSPTEDKFHFKKNEKEVIISVETYYELEKKYIIKNPHYPCLSVGPRDKNIHVPVELCTIVAGQATQKKLNENQTSAMIKEAATNTDIRKKKIMDTFKAMKHEKDLCMKEFDVTIGCNFEEVDARVLPTPKILYKDFQVDVSKGVWRANNFLIPTEQIQSPKSWTILSLENRTMEDRLYDFKKKLQQAGNNLGMKFGEPETPFENLNANNSEDLIEYLSTRKEKNLKLIIVIIPDKSYPTVKQIAELSIGVVTQCIRSKTLGKIYERNDQAIVGNILLKINAKLNGTNHSIIKGKQEFCRPPCLNDPCMIVGADVTHPPPDAKDIPSIAAVTASYDPNAFKYHVEIKLQPAKKEMILDLKEIMVNHLNFFKKATGHEPRRIIFYRDGVGEGDFEEVMRAEITAIRQACRIFNSDLEYTPPITFLVVQKRHHIRLFPKDRSGSDDYHKNKNVKAGTVVDTQITSPLYTNFYLVSHASIQGTARPTKYCCLWDDSNFSENQLEQLTYFLCHLFSRCTRSVSYPAPTYYAHLAAFRARVLTDGVTINMNDLLREQQRVMTIKDELLSGTPMFFV